MENVVNDRRVTAIVSLLTVGLGEERSQDLTESGKEYLPGLGRQHTRFRTHVIMHKHHTSIWV